MFRKAKPLAHDTIPGDYKIRIIREWHAEGFDEITQIPPAVFKDIDEWCSDMGLVPPSRTVPAFNPIHVVAGDSIKFSLDIKFSCGRAAMLFKLAHGGVGQIGIAHEVTI